jgi:hypothetical protein
MPILSKDIFFYGGIDTDSDDRLIKDGDYRTAVNARGPEATSSSGGAIENMTGHLYVENNALGDDDYVMGGCAYTERKSIVYFVFNAAGDHSIWYYNTQDQTHTLIIQDPILNFQIDRKINNAAVINNILYWTDGYFESYEVGVDGYWEFNPPRMINIDKAIAGYAVVDEALLDIIKAPAPYALNPQYITNGTQANNLYGQAYQFAIQWGYENGERSVWSVTSPVPVPTKQEYIQGRNYNQPFEDNAIQVDIPTGSEQVRYLRVAVRPGNDAPFQVFYESDKLIDVIADNVTIPVTYDGTVAGSTVPLVEGIRNYDRVPQVADTLEVLSSVNQLAFGKFVEGYAGVDLEDSGVSYYTTEIPNQVYGTDAKVSYTISSFVGWTLSIYTSSATQFNFCAGDVLIFQFSDFNVSTGSLGSPYFVSYTISSSDINDTTGLTLLQKRQVLINKVGLYLFDFFNDRYGLGNQTFISATGFSVSFFIEFLGDDRAALFSIKETKFYSLLSPIKTLKTGVLHEFGIQYYDRAMRNGDVLTNPNYQVYVDFPSQEDTSGFVDPRSPYFARPLLTGRNTPPIWAKYYQLVWRRTKIQNFQQRTAVSMYQDGSLYKVNLDTYYEQVWGAKINHQISVGDVFRIKNAQGEDVHDNVTGLPDYAYEYIEGRVERYDPVGGDNNGEAIWVTLFDYNAVIKYSESFVVEVYTARKDYIDEPFYEIGEVFDVVDPYTEDRRHGGKTYTGNVVTAPALGGNTFVVDGDVRPILLGNPNVPYEIAFFYTVGSDFVTTVTNVVYDYGTNTSTVTTSDNSNGDPYASYLFSTGSAQPGETFTIAHGYGDVYLRPRATNRQNTITGGNWRYWVEDPHISDYYISNAIDIGKLALVNKYGGRKNQKASLIHGGSYIDNTNVNNICSFDFNINNKIDLDEQFGDIRWIGMSGYTLKVLQDRKETSVYIQRATQVNGDGSVSVSNLNDRTWGGINPYESLYGTIHPLSVKVVAGQMFYYDYHSSRFIRSLTNGQQDICDGDFKFVKGASDITNAISLYGLDDMFVIASIDEQNKEYQCFFASTGEDVGSYLLGVVFSYSQSRWKTTLNWTPTWATNFGESLLYWNVKDPYVANEGTPLEFLGSASEFKVTPVFNDNAVLVKRPLALNLTCYPLASYVVASIPQTNSYNSQTTQMNENIFSVYENGMWTEYTMNENDPSFASASLANLNGDELRGYIIYHDVYYLGQEKFSLLRMRVNYIPSETAQ